MLVLFAILHLPLTTRPETKEAKDKKKAYQKYYRTTKEGKDKKKIYDATEGRKDKHRAYRSTKEAKAKQKDYQKVYRATEEYKAKIKIERERKLIIIGLTSLGSNDALREKPKITLSHSDTSQLDDIGKFDSFKIDNDIEDFEFNSDTSQLEDFDNFEFDDDIAK